MQVIHGRLEGWKVERISNSQGCAQRRNLGEKTGMKQAGIE
jgi:hypothetical protein